jgi:hypothetical protein
MSSGPAVAPSPTVASARAPAPWLARRLFPLLATVGLIVIGMASTTYFGPHLFGRTAWSLPDDLWGTLIAAQRLVHLDLSGLYTKPTGLVTFPGAAVILAPLVAVTDAAGLSLQHPGPLNPQPAVWLAAGPYMIAISSVPLFAADAIAERLGLTRPKRALLALASAVALWNVSVEWGHPEDAVAVGLLLFAILALSESRLERSAWLAGAAIAVQPLVLLALPIMLVVIQPRRLPGFLARAAVPATVLLAAVAAANWTATVNAVTRQPNWPTVDHPTPWISLAPRMAGGAVADGPARALAILVACGCALVVGPRLRAALRAPERSPGVLPARSRPPDVRARGNTWPPQVLLELLWWAAVALALRSVFEPVMVAYYVWPGLAVALITAASRNWARFLAASVVAAAITLASQATWRSTWGWWGLMVVGLALTLYFARVPRRRAVPSSARPQPAT